MCLLINHVDLLFILTITNYFGYMEAWPHPYHHNEIEPFIFERNYYGYQYYQDSNHYLERLFDTSNHRSTRYDTHFGKRHLRAIYQNRIPFRREKVWQKGWERYTTEDPNIEVRKSFQNIELFPQHYIYNEEDVYYTKDYFDIIKYTEIPQSWKSNKGNKGITPYIVWNVKNRNQNKNRNKNGNFNNNNNINHNTVHIYIVPNEPDGNPVVSSGPDPPSYPSVYTDQNPSYYPSNNPPNNPPDFPPGAYPFD